MSRSKQEAYQIDIVGLGRFSRGPETLECTDIIQEGLSKWLTHCRLGSSTMAVCVMEGLTVLLN